ncbi:MAG: hypothetical protein D6816_19115 [Bacteroidetes bacterium]|nr:MAG: hypothetical protein D6816_19115 [Bacteroidota bacterium]
MYIIIFVEVSTWPDTQQTSVLIMKTNIHNFDDPNRYLEDLIQRLFTDRVEKAKNDLNESIEKLNECTKKRTISIKSDLIQLEDELKNSLDLQNQTKEELDNLLESLSHVYEEGKSKVESIEHKLSSDLYQLRDQTQESVRQIKQDFISQVQDLNEHVRAVEKSVSMVLHQVQQLNKSEVDHTRLIQQEVVQVRSLMDEKLYDTISRLAEVTKGLCDEERLHTEQTMAALHQMRWWVAVSSILATTAIITVLVLLL